MPKLTKEQWEELRWRAKRNKDNPRFKEAIANISPRTSTKGNLHFGTRATYSKRNRAKGAKFWIKHNDRQNEQELSYLLPQDEREPNEYTPLNSRQIELLNKRGIEPTKENFLSAYEKEIRADYEKQHGRKMPSNSQPFIEAILNLKANHSIADIKKALQEANMPLKAIDIAIHRDEGHKNELTGETVKNYHAHIIFANYDFKTHRTILRTLSKKEFRECKERVIEALGMPLNKEKKKKFHSTRYQLQRQKEKRAEQLLKDLRAYEKEHLQTHENGSKINDNNLDNKNHTPKQNLNSFADEIAKRKARIEEYRKQKKDDDLAR